MAPRGMVKQCKGLKNDCCKKRDGYAKYALHHQWWCDGFDCVRFTGKFAFCPFFYGHGLPLLNLSSLHSPAFTFSFIIINTPQRFHHPRTQIHFFLFITLTTFVHSIHSASTQLFLPKSFSLPLVSLVSKRTYMLFSVQDASSTSKGTTTTYTFSP